MSCRPSDLAPARRDRRTQMQRVPSLLGSSFQPAGHTPSTGIGTHTEPSLVSTVVVLAGHGGTGWHVRAPSLVMKSSVPVGHPGMQVRPSLMMYSCVPAG